MGNYKHAHLRGSATFTRVAMNTGRRDVNKAHDLNQ